MEQGARSLGKLGDKRSSSRNLGQLRRLAAYLRPYRGHVLGRRRRAGAGVGRGAVAGHGAALPDRRRLQPGPSRRAEPCHRGRRHRDRRARGRDLPALLSGDLARRAGRGRPAPRRLPPRPASLAGLLRGHAHRRGALAPDHRYQRHPDRDRRQRHPGAPQRAADRGRPRAPGDHQPSAHRADPRRRAAGRGADRGDRAPRAAAVARGAGPHGGRLGRGRGDDQRDPHRAVLRSGGS